MSYNYKDIVALTPGYQTVEQKERLSRALVAKWEKTNLLKKLSEGSKKNMAILLENTARELRRMNESTTVSDIAGYNKVAFPLVRRTFGRLLANEIVSVQPMNMPAGLLFYLDFVYDRTKPGYTAESSIYGNRSTVVNSKLQGIGAQQATSGHYNLNSGYSKRYFIVSSASASYASITANSTTVTGTLSGFNFTILAASAVDISQTRLFRPVLASEINTTSTEPTYRGLTPVTDLDEDTLASTIDPGLTQIVSASVLRVYSTTYLAGGAYTGSSSAVLLGPASNYVDALAYPGTYTAEFESVSEIPQLNLQVRSVPVVAIERKLKTTWTPEMAQDIISFHNIDPDIELTKVMSQNVAVEIDNEILSDLLAGAEIKAVWSRKNGRFLKLNADGSISTLSFSDASNATYQSNFATQREWYDTLIEVINNVSNQIYKRNFRSAANWIVCSPEIASIIESMSMFSAEIVSDPNGGNNYSLGIVKIGTLQSRYIVYKSPYFPADKMLLGFKGDTFLETGYVYAPYVPLLVTPTIFEPENFTPRKAVMTRYATQMVRPEFYGVITVKDLDFVGWC